MQWKYTNDQVKRVARSYVGTFLEFLRSTDCATIQTVLFAYVSASIYLHLSRTLDPCYNVVIERRYPYRSIMRTALYWNEQQKTLVSLICHIIISLNDCWSCSACCRCYQLEYQISAAAPYTALNHGPIQCNVETACVFMMFMHLLIYLPPSYPSCLARLLRCIMLTLLLDRVY